MSKTEKVMVRITSDEERRLDRATERLGLSRSAVVRMALLTWLDEPRLPAPVPPAAVGAETGPTQL